MSAAERVPNKPPPPPRVVLPRVQLPKTLRHLGKAAKGGGGGKKDGWYGGMVDVVGWLVWWGG